MAGVNLSGFDPWPNIGGAGGIGGASGVLGSVGSLASGDWLGLGMKLLSGAFSGDTDQSSTGGMASGQLNTSGWVIGKGDALGGKSSLDASLTNASGAIPGWLLWLGGAALVVIVVKRL